MISSSLMALNTTSCCRLPNLYHMLRPVSWTSGLTISTRHFSCMSDNSKHSKFKSNFWSSPTKFVPLHISKWQLCPCSCTNPNASLFLSLLFLSYSTNQSFKLCQLYIQNIPKVSPLLTMSFYCKVCSELPLTINCLIMY